MDTVTRVQRAGTHRFFKKNAGETRELHSPLEKGAVSLIDRFKGNTKLESHDYGDIGWKRKKS